MVTRIPSPPNVVPPPLRQAANNPPYPTDRTMPALSAPEDRPSFEHVDSKGPSAPNGEGSRSRTSSVSSHDTWNSDPSEPEQEEEKDNLIPEALRPGPRKSAEQLRSTEDLPASLKPAIPKTPNGSIQSTGQAWPHYAPPQQTTPLQSQNPYLNLQHTTPMSQDQAHSPEPVELPTVKTPSEELAAMSLDAQATSPVPAAPSQAPPPVPPMPDGMPNVQSDNTGKSTASHVSRSSNPWQEDLDREQKSSVEPQSGESAAIPSVASSALPNAPAKDKQPEIAAAAPPQLPPLDISNASSSAAAAIRPSVETPRTQATRQRNEFYHIKHVNWFDASAKSGGAIRRSPILTQNANGPCPLLALVNALSLSTPESEETSLLHTLKSREQITLGLLLDAVFEELVRRNERSGHDLPDIGDLYAFLITLHTGMNVNPCFTTESPSQPGGFEQTREMQLYGSFDIPLVHGWISPSTSGVYQSFDRSAKTFDEALNLQFMEEELEAKLNSQGLSKEEQQVFEDMTAMKQFLTNFSTQLSDYGLETISSWMKPGQIAILFRNDHFCTLYKEPKKGTLMTLVTDMGYAGHDEVVWESLVDVNGAQAEFFSGDFRHVGAAPSASRQNSATTGNSESGWQTVSSRRNPKSPSTSTPPPRRSVTDAASLPQPTTKSEQEDLDLALALQLQEEEEDAHRREEARRQNEANESLSRQYLSQRDSSPSSTDQRPPIPPRRSQRQQSQQQQPIRPADRTDAGTAPPPTYEQAASDMPYREAGSTPRPPRQGNPLNALSALDAQRQQSAFAAQSGSQGPVMAPGYGRRGNRGSRFGSMGNGMGGAGPPQQGAYAGGGGRYGNNNDEKCVVM